MHKIRARISGVASKYLKSDEVSSTKPTPKLTPEAIARLRDRIKTEKPWKDTGSKLFRDGGSHSISEYDPDFHRIKHYDKIKISNETIQSESERRARAQMKAKRAIEGQQTMD